MKVTPLTLKKKLALELWREQNKLAVKEHPLRRLWADGWCCGQSWIVVGNGHLSCHEGRFANNLVSIKNI